MEASVDTLVYQLEDEDPQVRWQTLAKLRKIAAVESAHFPVRNPRRFLHCVRRRILDDKPQNALEALRLVTDIMGVLGDDVDQILSSVLPHLVSSLPKKSGAVGDDDNDETAPAHVTLHEETFQVFRKYVVVSNDLKAVAELLMNMGLAHASATVREASIIAIARLLEERYARKTKGARANFKANRMDKALFVALFQALVPVLEDNSENVVVVAEEVLGKLHLYWGDGIDNIMQFLSSEDRKTLRMHQEHINEFLEASCSESATPPSTSSSTATLRLPTPESPNDLDRPTTGSSIASSSSTSSETRLNSMGALHFGFVSDDILDALKTSTSNSNSDWKRRSAAVEKLFSALKQAKPAVLQHRIDEMEELFNIVVRLIQDADAHLVKRAVQITQLCFYKFSEAGDEEAAHQVGQGTGSVSAPSPQNAAFYTQKMVPHLVETAANFAEDAEMEAQLYALFAQLFQSGFLSVARANQTLLSSLQHRRLQVREEACKVWMLVLLVAERDGFNISKVLSHNVLQVLGRLLGDSSARVKEMAIEAGAVLAAVTSRPDLPELVEENLDEYLAERADIDGFRRRLRQKHLPVLLDNCLLSLTQGNKKTASVRNSYGSTATTGATETNITERSLSSVSELHMLAASKEFAPEYPPAVVRQSRHHLPPPPESVRASIKDGTSIRMATTPETAYGADTTSKSKFEYQSPSVVATNKTLVGTGTGGGSMSDRSYFMEGDEVSKELSSSSSAPVADKLAMLKKKATQLRKSSSSRQVHNVSSGDPDKGGMGYSEDSFSSSQNKSNQPPTRSQTSPEWCGDRTEDEPVVSARRQRKEETTPVVVTKHTVSSRIPKTRTPPPPDSNLSSPQKIQMLQSSGAAVGLSFEDRPIVSKYAVTAIQSKELDADDDDHDEDPPKAKVPHKSSTDYHHQDNSSSSPKWGNNDVEAPRKKAPPRVVSPARTRRDAEQISPFEQGPKSKTNHGGDGDNAETTSADTYVPSGKAASSASRPISLATRKRLEAKAKQDGLVLNSSSPSTDSPSYSIGSDPSSANVDDPKPLQKKASLTAMVKAGNLNNSDDSKPRPSGFGGKQEPKYLELHEIKPLPNPKQEVLKLLDKIRGADWEATFDVLSIVRRLALHHPIFLEDKIHAVTKEILGQVPNLRSTVSKNSLLALESMCSAYQKAMDPEVDAIIAVLIKRSADSNTFVCESATSSINSVILHCSASKVVNALAVHLTSKAVPLRREVARAMHTLIVSMGDQVQNSKDLGTILNIVGKCLEDSNNEVRDAAKQSIFYLCYEQRIDAEKLKRVLSGGARSKVDQMLSGNTKYVPSAVKLPAKAAAKSSTIAAPAASVAPQATKTKPEPSASSSSNAPGANSRTGSSSSSSSSGSSGVSASRKAPSAGVSVVDTVALEKLQKNLESSNWKDRYDALQETTTFVCSGGTAKALTESGKVTGLFDLIVKRMEDGNAKVNVFALECLEKMIPAFGNGMELVLSSFIPVLTKNLAANNSKLSSLTHTVIQVLCANVEAKLLCQHFAAIARHANSRIKPLLIDTLDQLVATSDEKNQYALNRYVLPLALELMKEAKSDVKDANTRLLRSLYASLGPTMLQAVYKQSTAQQERITSILGISSFAKGRTNGESKMMNVDSSGNMVVSPISARGQERLARLRATIQQQFGGDGGNSRVSTSSQQRERAVSRGLNMDHVQSHPQQPRSKIRQRIEQASRMTSDEIFFREFGSPKQLMALDFDLARTEQPRLANRHIDANLRSSSVIGTGKAVRTTTQQYPNAPQPLFSSSSARAEQAQIQASVERIYSAVPSAIRSQSAYDRSHSHSSAQVAAGGRSESSMAPSASFAAQAHARAPAATNTERPTYVSQLQRPTRILTPKKQSLKRLRAADEPPSAEKTLPPAQKPRLLTDVTSNFNNRSFSNVGQVRGSSASYTNSPVRKAPAFPRQTMLQLPSPSKFRVPTSTTRLFGQRQSSYR